MANPSKTKGTAFETLLVKKAREHGVDAERLPLSGAGDVGDLVYKYEDRDGRKRVIVIEAKATQKLNVTDYIAQAMEERDNYCRQRGLDPATVEGIAVWKRRMKGWDDAVVLLPLREYLRLKEGTE